MKKPSGFFFIINYRNYSNSFIKFGLVSFITHLCYLYMFRQGFIYRGASLNVVSNAQF